MDTQEEQSLTPSIEREEFSIIRECLKEIKQIGEITNFIRHSTVAEKSVEGEPPSTQIVNKLRELRRALRELRSSY